MPYHIPFQYIVYQKNIFFHERQPLHPLLSIRGILYSDLSNLILMKYIYRVLVFSILFSCENKSIFEKETSTVNSFPQTITLKGEEQKLEALGIVDIMVIDTFLIAYTPMNHDYYYLVYSTSNLKKLGKFLPEGRGANEFYALVHDKCHETEDGIIKTWLNNGFI